jgi:glutamine amidotransferase
MITIVDYGLGNLGSMANMLKKIGAPSRVSGDPADVLSAEKLILPGIGAFDQGIISLRERGLIEPLTKRVVADRVPLIGVCLGMQLLGFASEEGREAGLGWIRARTIGFTNTPGCQGLRVPHMGWNIAKAVKSDPILRGLEERPRFYFVHSYHVVCESRDDVLATTEYGIEFVAILRHGNIWGAQFHPEKSHRFGMQLLRNFVELTPC